MMRWGRVAGGTGVNSSPICSLNISPVNQASPPELFQESELVIDLRVKKKKAVDMCQSQSFFCLQMCEMLKEPSKDL